MDSYRHNDIEQLMNDTKSAEGYLDIARSHLGCMNQIGSGSSVRMHLIMIEMWILYKVQCFLHPLGCVLILRVMTVSSDESLASSLTENVIMFCREGLTTFTL